MSSHTQRVASCILRLFDEQLMPDTSIVAGGKEIRAHRAVLAASSGFFRDHFGAGGADKIEVKEPYKAVRALIRFLYFGNITESELGPEDALDLLASARDYGIEVLHQEDVVDLIVPQLTLQNCLPVLLHVELLNHPKIAAGVCEYIGQNFAKLLASSTSRMHMMTIRKHYLLDIVKVVCRYCSNEVAAEQTVQFCLEYSQMDNACDLLRECKTWQWNAEAGKLTKLRDPSDKPKETQAEAKPSMADMSEEEIFNYLDVNKDGVVSREEFASFKAAVASASSYTYVDEWVIPKVKDRLNSEEALCYLSCGDFFEWRVRVDNGAEGKLRIVYEDVTPKHASASCCRRFPAATFAWKVKYRGEEIFNDRPVFITFAERVSLHWSTTLGLDANMLSDDDEISISVCMTENPLLSLLLYFLSSNVKNENYAEDILNRLPHIEYRCLSSYFIFRQASRPPSAAALNVTQPA